MQMRRQFAQLIRQMPFLMRVPYMAYRFIQPKFSVGVVGVVMNASQEILLVEHVFHPKLAWGLPGGWTDANESPQITIIRELKEELGLTVEVDSLLLADKTKYRHIDFAYLCVTDDEVSSLSYELLNYNWVAYDDLPIINPFHLAAIDAAIELLASKE